MNTHLILSKNDFYDIRENGNLDKCIECNCCLGDDWSYIDFSNKDYIICPQCGTVYLI